MQKDAQTNKSILLFIYYAYICIIGNVIIGEQIYVLQNKFKNWKIDNIETRS